MPKFLTVKEAAKITGKSPSSIRRIIYPILQNDKHPDRSQIQPDVEQAKALRMKGENFPWKISEKLLRREVPEGSVKGSTESKGSSSVSNDGSAALIDMLRGELEIKNQQIATQNELMKGLSERLHEGNMCLNHKQPEPTLMATPYWMIQQLGMAMGGFQYEQLRASLERLAVVAYQNTAFYNPVTQQHERVTLHFFSSYLPTRGRGAAVDAERAWRIEWSPMFFKMCQATGGTLLFDLDVYRDLSPAARRLFLKLKDRFWRSKRVFLNVDDLTINGLGFSADRPLYKRKFDLTGCICELLGTGIIEFGRGQTDPIGDRRMFFSPQSWWLPDQTLAIPGCFSLPPYNLLASTCQKNNIASRLTKRLSKRYLLKQSRAGYRPPAWKRIVDELNEPAERSVSIAQLRRRNATIAARAWR